MVKHVGGVALFFFPLYLTSVWHTEEQERKKAWSSMLVVLRSSSSLFTSPPCGTQKSRSARKHGQACWWCCALLLPSLPHLRVAHRRAGAQESMVKHVGGVALFFFPLYLTSVWHTEEQE